MSISAISFSEGIDMVKNIENEIMRLEKSNEKISSKIATWESLKDKYKGTGLYEYELSKLYIDAHDYAMSRAAIEEGLKYKTEYVKGLWLAYGDTYLKEGSYAEAEDKYLKAVNADPSWFEGYHKLGFVQFIQGRYEKAIRNFLEANKLYEQSKTYNYLCLSYYSLGNYQKAIAALDRAFQLDQSVVGDRDAMIIGARSYAEIGKFDISKKLLAMLLNKRPELIEDKEFIKAGLFLRQKMIAAGVLLAR